MMYKSKTVFIVCLIDVKQRNRSVHLHNDMKSLLVYITRQPLLHEIEAPQIMQIFKTVVCPIKTTAFFKISINIHNMKTVFT